MTVATYTLTENAATNITREVKIGIRAKAGSSNPSKASDWKGGAFPTMTFSLPVNANKAEATIETAGNSAVDGNREFEFYEVSRSPSGGQLTLQLTSGTITDDDTAPVATFIQPSNREYVALGDSRSQFWGNDGSNHPYQWLISTTDVSQVDYLAAFTDGRLICASRFNYGIGGNSIAQIRARTDGSGKSLAQLAANRAAIVIFLAGTNNANTTPEIATLANGGSGRVDMAYMIDYLTNPASGAPFFGGQPKTILLMNEWPRGKNDAGGVQSPVPADGYATWKSYSDWLLRFSYDSGDALANPRVLAIDTFNAPAILDPATGYNRQGLLGDGLHAGSPMAVEVAKVIAGRVNPLLSTNGSPLRPSSANAGLIINSNPFMTGTGGTRAYSFDYNHGTLVGVLPSQTTLLANNTDLTGITVTTSIEGTGDDRELVMRFTGTSSSGWQMEFSQGFNNMSVVDANDQMYAAAEILVTNSGAVKVSGRLGMHCSYSPDEKGSADTNVNWSNAIVDGTYKKLATPLIDRGDGTGKLPSFDGGNISFLASGPTGSVDSTIKLRRFGAMAAKVA